MENGPSDCPSRRVLFRVLESDLSSIHRRGQGGLGGLAPAKLKVSPPNKPQCSPPKESAVVGVLH
jgi:hypothetical protein